MDDLVENQVIRFTNISRKKNTILANFKAKALKNGVAFTASISVDISTLELHTGDSLDKIIEQCAKHAIEQFKKADLQFEGLVGISESYLGVAQLG